MKYEIKQKRVVFIGDIHASTFSARNTIYKGEDDTAYIFLGDIGLGFRMTEYCDPYDRSVDVIEAISEILKKNSKAYFFRGNHDDPEFFTGKTKEMLKEEFNNVEFLEDFDELVMPDGKVALVIPGGVSVDRYDRVKGCSYWVDEFIKFDKLDTLDKQYDIVISHSGPVPSPIAEKDKRGESSIVTFYSQLDKELLNDLAKEAEFWDKLLEKVKPAKMFCGHYHLSAEDKIGGCTIKFLDIFETAVY